MFCLIFSKEKLSAQCTLETQKSSTEMEKNSNFQKCPKTFPRLSKHVLMWFFRNFLASAPWRVEKSKNFKEMQKLPKIQDTQTRFQKYPNKFWTCFEVFLEKKCSVHPGGSKFGKTWEKLKNFFFQNDQNLSQKCSNKFSTCSEVVFLLKKWPIYPGGSKLGTIRKKVENILKFQKCPKTLLRVSKQDLRWFYRNFLVSEPWRVEKSKNFKEMQKLPKIQDTQTRFQKYPNNFWTCFEVFSRKKSAQCTLEGRNLEKFEKIEKIWIPKSVQKRS